MTRLITFISILTISLSIFSCRKPRNGTYVMTRDGMTTTTTCPAPSNCSTSTSLDNSSQDVEIKYSKKSTVEINGETWTKNKNTLTFNSIDRGKVSPGATVGGTVNYVGEIKNKFLIEGTYTITSSTYSGAYILWSHSEGLFTIKKK